MKTKVFLLSILISLLSFYSCKTTCCHNQTDVSFGVNLNGRTDLTAIVYVDGSKIAQIPGSVNSVETCDSSATLNVVFGESLHLYKIVIFDSQNDTVAVSEGEFDVNQSDCIKIFYELKE